MELNPQKQRLKKIIDQLFFGLVASIFSIFSLIYLALSVHLQIHYLGQPLPTSRREDFIDYIVFTIISLLLSIGFWVVTFNWKNKK